MDFFVFLLVIPFYLNTPSSVLSIWSTVVIRICATTFIYVLPYLDHEVVQNYEVKGKVITAMI